MRQMSWYLKRLLALELSYELGDLHGYYMSWSALLDRNLFYLMLAAVRVCCSGASSYLVQVAWATLRVVWFDLECGVNSAPGLPGLSLDPALRIFLWLVCIWRAVSLSPRPSSIGVTTAVTYCSCLLIYYHLSETLSVQ